MLDVKTVADTLTAGRFLLALAIFWLGLKVGRPALPTVTLALVLGWVSDVLDGALARRTLIQRHTWLGDNDLSVDVCVALGLLGYLVLSRYVSPAVAVSRLIPTPASVCVPSWRIAADTGCTGFCTASVASCTGFCTASDTASKARR